MSDRFKNMTKQDKRKMLHEGLSEGAQASTQNKREDMSFCVDVVLDNTSG